MPVQWRSGSRRPVGPGFCSIKKQDRIVMPLCSPSDYAIIRMHRWVERLGESYPCLGPDECKYHDTPVIDYAYAPILAYDALRKTWQQQILGLGNPNSDLALGDYKGQIIVIGRQKDMGNRGPLVLVSRGRPEWSKPNLSTDTFDVRPHLLRRWGLFKEADLIGCEFHEGEMLPFPDTQVG